LELGTGAGVQTNQPKIKIKKKTIFSRFMVSFDYPAHSIQETVLPVVPMESRDFKGVPFASLESL